MSIFDIKKPTKKLKEICSQLGAEYSIRVIDCEQVIYRKISPFYDLEVSGLNNQSKTINCSIYIHNISNGDGYAARIAEKIHDIKSLESLKDLLSSLVERYQNLS